MARRKVVFDAFVELIIKLTEIASLNQAINTAENIVSDINQRGIQIVQRPDGRFVISNLRLAPPCVGNDSKIASKSQENVVDRGGIEESVSNLPIPDEELRTMTVVELNRAVREAEYDRTTTLEIKHRRRKLKNRGYAANYRWKGIKKTDQLIVELKSISGKD